MKSKDDRHWYTNIEIKFLKRNCKYHSYRELTDIFNETFSLSLSVTQVKAAMKNRGITNGRDCRFPPGHKPFNKGVKGTRVSVATEFKKGNKPANHMPVGSERINGDGYLDVKVREPNKWVGKHRIIYEQKNGPIPKGDVIIFADGNKRNLDPTNLLKVSRKELIVMNRSKLIFNDKDLTKSGQLIAALKIKIADSTRRAS